MKPSQARPVYHNLHWKPSRQGLLLPYPQLNPSSENKNKQTKPSTHDKRSDSIKEQKYLIFLLNKFLFKTKMMKKMAENSGDNLDHQIRKGI